MTEVLLEDLDHVGPATAQKLKDAGFTTIEAIAVASPAELANSAEIGESTAAKIINAARQSADVGGFETGDLVLERRKLVGKLSTGCTEFDEMMGGGIETQSITEMYGEFGSGKTQIAHQLAVNVQLPPEQGGLGGSVIMIDTENTFRPERIAQMVKGISDKHGIEYDPEEFLKNIHVARAFNSNHQILLVDSANELANELKNTEMPVKLLIVDSLTAHFRAEYIGRGTLADRQQKLNKHLHDILRFGDLSNACVVVTNQVMSKPDAFFGDPTKPIGGHILGHTATFRLYIRKSKGEKRIVKLVDSPNLPDGEALISVTTDGIGDA
ncbi:MULTISPECIES: DNA repair and recombination protein RadA [Methanococcoides]|jgi:DNA repair protein RadA|uniref:DNA repair and recombination protein RadA n=1 Tax=Methanococcoides alaskense TaxID=325778 RepID=A0AA90TYV6_9EURY|nr:MULTISPECIES: DNA repair and recombination protein RadA [Methanococcoides]MCD4801023.1 DNA repair and recombination protein RadA [Methanococcoides sp.]MCD4807526.1 DNA repair and recombination protein RadA [Methanococcoides sp.]MCD4822877.1 DNA repair and recombination protein RadA [Methanococcoides sp.]MDA0524633.1 DNA repair and recombination protein RadA [Methanococcoides alaskense]MDR6222445.1 DNA repair protein RadA [Methanococcoides alaskense]